MIRWARSDETGSAIAWERERRLRWQALNRVARPEHRLVPWIGLWAIVILAQFGALIPVLFERTGPLGSSEVFSLVGGSFAACGLVAWGRRPDSLSGPLMVATGLLSFVYPLFSQLDFAPAVTVGHLFADAWVVCFILLLLTFPTSGRLRSHADRRLVALSAIPLVALQLIYMQFHAEDGNLLLITSERGDRRRRRQDPADLDRARVRRGRRRARRALARRLGPAPSRAAPQRRRCHLPAAVRGAARQRPRDRLALDPS